MGVIKVLGPHGFPTAFFQIFWADLKEDVMGVMHEFHLRGKLSKNLGASFITVITKMVDAKYLKVFRPISLIGSINKINH